MLPIERFLVALLPITTYIIVRDRQLPTPKLVGLIFVGSQFPDLVDKPLAHVLHLLPSGRVFMHSLPFALPIAAIAIGYGWWTDRPRLGTGFAFAYLSHLVADNYRTLRPPEPHISPDLLWPFRQPITRPPIPYWAGPGSINLALWTAFSITVLAICTFLVIRDVQTHYRQ